ncbi:putative 2-ketoarginine decarboxylase AruI [Aliiroseovarius sp. xm-m-379]|uniref:5-guanidino-2-oxopentanoate decarboxylase n=1 Tax=unclassified Aliiroseovarius TaxID=2623558 RepID=UPI00156A224D|nr:MULTISPECIES: 5-guanidino-2-oxopentanoate decarboxylase [unclassified Aliiroseovarius]NRP12681.1 putative 2-ketoarginine decarboxylase AruI [Aliiroseovarius sp. xm-d-517]NRP24486.1 putative 2-ketoarginine decarboxylase AruI [Aliiroseovarius sp. xm-m-379]NRP29704.1 putative 2-ketoarginine decarboxylase AruI [Aliiroseovarius sp. xm-m-314]NRP33285.1 putative 2-ketoarginine decarboxylase AruI [Aliiroseovarius sp. xm-a-104]NRP39714.1 putative 2-ketoarginine decarboxylase AruI [Aliiroseovarius sp
MSHNSTLEKPLGAQISHMLKSRGVEVIFAIPGVHNIEMYRGLDEAGITPVLARHEQGAGFMADGYARATGQPGVCYLITGPGLCNAMTALGQSYSDSVPVLAISSCLNPEDLGMGRGRLHEMKDQEAAAATVCDWSHTAMDAPSAYRLIDRAMMEFATRRPRPKHIQIPVNALAQRSAQAPETGVLPARPLAPPEQVAAVAEWLLGAERPLFIFGGGAIEGADAARALVELTGAASICTVAGHGVIADNAPLAYGPILPRPDSVQEIAKADLIVAVGTELSETDLWRDRLGHEAPMIRVDLDPMVLADDHRADLPVLGDAGPFLEDLRALLDGQSKRSTGWSQAEVIQARARFHLEADQERPDILPICERLGPAIPDETMIFSDMTQFAYVANEVWPLDRPGHWHHPSGFGALGYALPAAIGGKIGRPDLPVLAIAGDYGFQFTLQELGVAVELGLALPILLWDNDKLKEIEDCMVGRQIAPGSASVRNPDFCALARAYGAFAEKPGSLAALIETVNAAFTADGPTLIHVTPEVLRG